MTKSTADSRMSCSVIAGIMDKAYPMPCTATSDPLGTVTYVIASMDSNLCW